MTAKATPALPQTCCPSVWLWPGQALYAGPSLNLSPHSGSVWCLAVGIGGPLTVATADGATPAARSVLIPPRLTHQLSCHGAGLVSCYLEPTSDRGDAGRHKFGERHSGVGVGHVDEERLQFTPSDDEAPRTGSIWRRPRRNDASIPASPPRPAESAKTRRPRSRRVSSPLRRGCPSRDSCTCSATSSAPACAGIGSGSG